MEVRGLAASRGDGDGEPARLERTDIHGAVDDASEAALVGGDAGGNEGVVARVDGRAAGQEGHGLGRAAVIAQRCQQRVERLAMVPVRSEPTQPELPSVSPIRLLPWDVKDVPAFSKASGPLPVAVFPATIELATFIVPARRYSPPPLPVVELPLTVQLVSVVVPRLQLYDAATPIRAGGIAAEGAVGQRRRAVAVHDGAAVECWRNCR